MRLSKILPAINSNHQKASRRQKKVPSPRGNKKQGVRTKRTHQITDCPADFNPVYLSARADSAGSSAACFCDRTISSSDRALSANDLSHQRQHQHQQQQQHPPTKFKRHSTKKVDSRFSEILIVRKRAVGLKKFY